MEVALFRPLLLFMLYEVAYKMFACQWWNVYQSMVEYNTELSMHKITFSAGLGLVSVQST